MDEDYDGSLEKGCPYCKGSGRVPNIEIIKWQLGGFEGSEPKDVFVTCPICNGLGVIPTHNGFGILDFIGKYGGVA